MPLMNFDLLDGMPPVSFSINGEGAERMMHFMSECQQERDAYAMLTEEITELRARVESLAAPSVANGAPAGELPPLPEPLDDRKLFKLVNALGAFGGGVSRDSIGPQQEAVANLDAYLMGMMQAYAHAAIAALPKPVVAMTDDAKKGPIWGAIQKACGDLPDGYEIRLHMENGYGGIEWESPSGIVTLIDGEGFISADIEEALAAALAAHAGQGAKT